MRTGWGLLLALGLTLAGCTLAEDITPPPGFDSTQAALPAPPTAVPVNLVPAAQPNPAAGEALYTDRCLPCHGAQGLGDGPQAAQLSAVPAPLGDAAYVRQAIPGDWYQVVTQGRLDRMMPPFTSLTDAQRWDVVAFSLGLSQTTADIDQGRQIYTASCASCHGSDGSTLTGGTQLSDPAFMAKQSLASMASVIGQGSGDMPAFAGQLSDSQVLQVSAFVRQLAFSAEAPPPSAASQPPGQSAPAAGTASISARVVLAPGAAEQGAQSGFEITLHGFDGQQESLTQTATAGEDGTALFANLDIVSGRVFILSTEYQGIQYASDVTRLSDPGQTVELPITLYGTTTDTSAVRASRLHLILNFPSDGLMQVIELWVLSNTGDRTVVADVSGGLVFSLPQGASEISFEDTSLAQDATSTQDGFTLATPLQPGQQTTQLVFSFNVPYQNRISFDQPVSYPVDGITVLLPNGGPSISGASVQDQGVQNLGGQEYHQYSLASLSSGQSIQMAVVGRTTPLVAGNWTALAIGAVALLVVVGLGIIWYRPAWLGLGGPSDAAPEEDESDSAEALLAGIARLDDAYEAGKVDEADYRRRREELKRQALAAMRESHD